MNHPTPEDWMAHLYGETSAARRDELDAHLASCPACAARAKSWRDGMAALDEWKLPTSRRPRGTGSWLRWAAAAAVVLALGFAVGRFSAGNSHAMQVAMQKEFDLRLTLAREELRASTSAETQRVLEIFAASLEEKQAGEAASFVAALRQMDARHAAKLARLRRDLDTVAVVADGRLSDTQEQLYQLASSRMDNRPQPDNE